MALRKLPKECLVCLNSSETRFVPTEESQKIFSVCCQYVKDAINIDFLINSIINNNSQLWFCKNCLHLSMTLYEFVEQRSKLKTEINDLSNRFSETIAKQRIQATVNTRKKRNRNTKFHAANNQKSNPDSSDTTFSHLFSGDFNQDSEYSTNKLRTEQDAADEIANDIVKTEIDDNSQDYEDEGCTDNVSSDKEDEYETKQLAREDENDSSGELDLEPTFAIVNNSNVVNDNELKSQIGTRKLPSKSVVSLRKPNIMLKRIPNNVTTKLDTYNSTDTSHQDRSGVDFNKNFPGGSSPKDSENESDNGTNKSEKVRKQHNCPTCERIFFSASNLKRHLVSHARQKPYLCTTCGKSYGYQRDLRVHERIHTGERPYQCSFCESSFIRMNGLKDHEALHRNEKPYKCSHCEKAFMRPSHLKHHVKINHTGPKKSYKCTQCKMTFLSQIQLSCHQRIHKTLNRDSKKLFNCSYCNLKFDRSHDLKDHVRLHTGETPYKCNYCETSFTTRAGRRRHHAKFHPDNMQKNSKEICLPFNVCSK